MADRTWNPCDARLYDEPWSAGAIIVANCLLTRCPNQYGVFDFPLGFILRFYQGIFSPLEIEGFMQEWEAAGFATFYKDRTVIWIRSKWKRAGQPNENHWKGLNNHLEAYPEVRKAFLSLYEPHWKGIETPSKGDTHPHRNSESDSDSDTEKKKSKTCFPEQKQGQLGFEGSEEGEEVTRAKTTRKPTLWALEDIPDDIKFFVFDVLEGQLSDKNTRRQCDALNRLLHSDKGRIAPDYTDIQWQAEVKSVLLWMRADNTPNDNNFCWDAVFQSIVQLRRNDLQKYRNARAQFLRAPKKQHPRDKKSFFETEEIVELSVHD